jgi:hypothetical protein
MDLIIQTRGSISVVANLKRKKQKEDVFPYNRDGR